MLLFQLAQGHSSDFAQHDRTHVADCTASRSMRYRWHHFYIVAPADEALAICTWLLLTAAAFMNPSSSLTLRWHPPFTHRQTLFHFYSVSSTPHPMHFYLQEKKKKENRSIDFLKLLSDVEWFSSPHAPCLVWTLRMSLFRAGQGWITQTHWWIWMRPCPPSCLHSSGNDGQSQLECTPCRRPSV